MPCLYRILQVAEMKRECPYCHGPFAGGYFCAPCIRELVAEGRYAEMMDSYYPLKKEKIKCPTNSK